MEDYAEGLGEQAELVARAIKEKVEESEEHPANFEDLISTLQVYAGQTGTEVNLIGRDGLFWAGSGDGVPDVDTPEVKAGLSGQISSDIRVNQAFAAAPILEDGRLFGVVQLVAPLSATQALVLERWLTLAGAVLVVTILAGAAAFLLSTTLTRPLEGLREAALKMARGDFGQRLPEVRQDEIGEVARAFNYMANEIESMIEEQRAFASNASHELRTPLTTIRLRSEALRDGGLDPETARRYVIEMDDEVQRLGDLVQELMMLSRLDSGRLEVGREQIDMFRLAHQLLAEIRPTAEERSIKLQLSLPSELPVVQAGTSHVMSVFRNLLMNALKYTADGGQIEWQIKAAGNEIEHLIIDNGQGITGQDLAHVFDRFYRADKSRSRSVPGVGLGLPLVRMIVEFYGGEVSLASPGIGQGTTARVLWPIMGHAV